RRARTEPAPRPSQLRLHLLDELTERLASQPGEHVRGAVEEPVLQHRARDGNTVPMANPHGLRTPEIPHATRSLLLAVLMLFPCAIELEEPVPGHEIEIKGAPGRDDRADLEPTSHRAERIGRPLSRRPVLHELGSWH